LTAGLDFLVKFRWRCTLAPPDEYHWTVHVWQWCGWPLVINSIN